MYVVESIREGMLPVVQRKLFDMPYLTLIPFIV